MPFARRVSIAIAAVIALACTPIRPETAPDPLAARADTLIERLLDTPGSFATGSDNVYVFITDQRALDELSALNLHAVPELIQCMADERPSRVAYGADATRALRGAVCFEMLVRTEFFQKRDDVLYRSALKPAGCNECVAGYQSTAADLRKAQRVWQRYHAAYRAAHPVTE